MNRDRPRSNMNMNGKKISEQALSLSDSRTGWGVQASSKDLKRALNDWESRNGLNGGRGGFSYGRRGKNNLRGDER